MTKAGNGQSRASGAWLTGQAGCPSKPDASRLIDITGILHKRRLSQARTLDSALNAVGTHNVYYVKLDKHEHTPTLPALYQWLIALWALKSSNGFISFESALQEPFDGYSQTPLLAIRHDGCQQTDLACRQTLHSRAPFCCLRLQAVADFYQPFYIFIIAIFLRYFFVYQKDKVFIECIAKLRIGTFF